MTARVSMLLKSRASPDTLPFSHCNNNRLAMRHMNRPLFPKTQSIPSYDIEKQVRLRTYQHHTYKISLICICCAVIGLDNKFLQHLAKPASQEVSNFEIFSIFLLLPTFLLRSKPFYNTPNLIYKTYQLRLKKIYKTASTHIRYSRLYKWYI